MVFTLMGEGAMVPASALVGLALLLDSRYGTRQTGVIMVFPASGGPAFLRDRGPPRRECPPPECRVQRRPTAGTWGRGRGLIQVPSLRVLTLGGCLPGTLQLENEDRVVGNAPKDAPEPFRRSERFLK